MNSEKELNRKKATDKLKYQLIDVNELIPYELNSKKHSEANIAGLMASIKEHGLNNPITVDKNMVIIGGHGRLEACKRLGHRVVRVQIRDDLDEQGVKQLRIAENKTASTEYDSELLKLELEQIDLKEINLDSLGIDQAEFDKLMADYTEMDLDSLTNDLDGEINKQIKQGEKDIKSADYQRVSLVSAFGFKDVSVAGSRAIARFIAGLQSTYNLSPDQAFVQFIKDLEDDGK